jgi:hypothetical protein
MGEPVANWREVADKVMAEEGVAVPSPSHIPDVLRSGIQSMQRASKRVRDQVAWRQVAGDARLLLDQGWVARALSLGWHATDLFGVSPDGGGDFEGLAVWLRGDRIVLMDERTAISARGETRRVFNRRLPTPGATIFIWDLGR